MEKLIIEFSQLITNAKTNQVHDWTIEFIEQCSSWCILLETEASILNKNELDEYLSNHELTSSNLCHALHYFYFTLLQNTFLNNTVYYFILNHYQFLTNHDKDLIIKDLSLLANQSTTETILLDLINELESS